MHQIIVSQLLIYPNLAKIPITFHYIPPSRIRMFLSPFALTTLEIYAPFHIFIKKNKMKELVPFLYQAGDSKPAEPYTTLILTLRGHSNFYQT